MLEEASGNDPRFAAYREQQLGEVSRQKEELRSNLERQGVTGTALQNELANFDRQSSGVSAQIGMQEMGRQDELRQGALNVMNQRGQFMGAGAGLNAQDQ